MDSVSMLSVWYRMFATTVVLCTMSMLAVRAKRWWQVALAVLIALPFANRDAFLPFLGRAAYPCDSLKLTTPEGADVEIAIRTVPGARVAYWAADGTGDYRAAYGDLSNSGVALADADGVAKLAVRTPREYSVGWGKKLRPHVHYRVCTGHGMIGRVETVAAAKMAEKKVWYV